MPDLASLPARAAGSLTNDLAADADDIATLKQRLGRARERLSFYESFDRIIQENIRRSSELMIEATELHEQAERANAAHARAQAELAAQRIADRARYAALLDDLRSELNHTRTVLEGIATRVTSALDALARDAAPAQPIGTSTLMDASAAASVVSPAAPPTAEEAPAATATAPAAPASLPPTPRTIDVLVHGVPTARVAISLQDHLCRLDQVTGVEAREFVDGLLRLQVTATAPLEIADLAGWTDGAGAETVRALPEVLEFGLPGTAQR